MVASLSVIEICTKNQSPIEPLKAKHYCTHRYQIVMLSTPPINNTLDINPTNLEVPHLPHLGEVLHDHDS